MRALLDTHFVIWIFEASPRLDRFQWIRSYEPWGVSPITLLELTYLIEGGRVRTERDLPDRLRSDPRFDIDDVSLETLIRHAIPLSWTRDPFDRLIAAHSAARRIPLCSVNDRIRRNHAFVPAELSLT